MAELFTDLIELVSEAIAMDGAEAGIYGFFVLWLLFFIPCCFADLGLQTLNSAREHRRAAECFARYRSETSTVCRVRSCPHAAGCQFYEKRPSLWSRLKVWIQKKKNSRE